MVGSAEGARAGRFPALSIRSKLTSAGRSLAGCTSNQPRRPNQRRPALRRGGRGKRTSCSTGGSGGTASDRGRKLRGSFVLGARSGGGYYSLRDSGGVRWISAQLRDGKTTRGRPAWPTTRRTVAWTSRCRPYHIGQCSVLGCLGAARAPCRAYLILARRRPPPRRRRGADRTDEVSVRRFSCLGLGKRTCTPNHAWRDLCGQMWVRVFCGQKGGREGGGAAAFSAVQPPAGLYVRRWLIRDVCLPFRPPRCGRAGAIPVFMRCYERQSTIRVWFFFLRP